MQHASLHLLAAKRRAQTRHAQMRRASFLCHPDGLVVKPQKFVFGIFVRNSVLDSNKQKPNTLQVYSGASTAHFLVHLKSPRSTCGLVWRTSELCLLSRSTRRSSALAVSRSDVGRPRRFIRAIHRCVRRLVQHVAHARRKNFLLVEVPRGNVPTRVVSQYVHAPSHMCL